jgi:hypothetical protein
MKPKLILISFITIMLLTAASAGYATMADYSLPWWTVDGGGGNSNSGQYALSGTIGQADAGLLTGGQYALTGGFWGGIQLEQQIYLSIIIR